MVQQSQLASQELRPSKAETPILLRVLYQRDNQIGSRDTALRLQLFSQSSIQSLLLLLTPTLLEYLNNDKLAGSFILSLGRSSRTVRAGL